MFLYWLPPPLVLFKYVFPVTSSLSQSKKLKFLSANDNVKDTVLNPPMASITL